MPRGWPTTTLRLRRIGAMKSKGSDLQEVQLAGLQRAARVAWSAMLISSIRSIFGTLPPASASGASSRGR